jgi:hypothetical protein
MVLWPIRLVRFDAISTMPVPPGAITILLGGIATIMPGERLVSHIRGTLPEHKGRDKDFMSGDVVAL